MTINHEMVREGINHFEAEDAARHSADFSNLARCYLDMETQRDAAVATHTQLRAELRAAIELAIKAKGAP